MSGLAEGMHIAAGRGHDPRRGRFVAVMIAGVAILLMSSIAGMLVGSSDLPPGQVLAVLADRVVPAGWVDLGSVREVDQRIVWAVRLPRVCLAGLVGALLALAGVQMQGLFRNPLATPDIIGTSQGAALGAVVALATGLAVRSLWSVPVLAFAGAFVALLVLSRLAGLARVGGVGTLLLAGVALNFLISAAVTLIISLSWERYEVSLQIMVWLMGGVEGRSWLHVAMAVPVLAVGLAAAMWIGRDLDLMQEGEESAGGLGVDTARVTRIALLLAALLTGASVAVSGVVGFVGLVVPHMVRLLIGPQHARLNVACVVTGAWFVILADLAARTVRRPVELQLGIVTALVGAPFFMFLLIRHRREGAL